MKSNVKSFLENLEELNNSNTVTVKIPSTGNEVEFKLASVSQQKELLSTLFGDSVESIFTRTNVFNRIIEANCKEDLDFLIIDREAIMLAIRKKLFGSSYSIKGVKYDLDNLTPIDTSTLDLTTVVEYDGIVANIAIPTLKTDTDINLKILDDLSKQIGTDNINEKFALIATHEVSKYIADITINDITIVFDEISVYERVKIVSNLPLKLNTEIVNYITVIKELVEQALTLPDGIFVEIAAGFLSGD